MNITIYGWTTRGHRDGPGGYGGFGGTGKCGHCHELSSRIVD
jgi:hypothetical protein